MGSRTVLKYLVAASILLVGRSSHATWYSLSGPNYSQVTVAADVACAVQSPQPQAWGGTLDCYAPSGTTGAARVGIAGEQGQNPGPFASSDPSKRMVSVALSPLPAASPLFLYVLRSDSTVFSAVTLWPKAANGDPRTTTEFYGHLAAHYLKKEIERLSFGAPLAEPATSPPQPAQEPHISLVAGGAPEPPLPATTRAPARRAAPFATHPRKGPPTVNPACSRWKGSART